jgi:DNA-binding cell septation regulator SpoVG
MNRRISYILNTGPKKKLKQSKFSLFSHDISSTKKKRIIESVIEEANNDQKKLMERAQQIQVAN